jgi:hypothetical protein
MALRGLRKGGPVFHCEPVLNRLTAHWFHCWFGSRSFRRLRLRGTGEGREDRQRDDAHDRHFHTWRF